jgi:hypothetical protein
MISYGSWSINPTSELFKHLKLYKAGLIGKDEIDEVAEKSPQQQLR